MCHGNTFARTSLTNGKCDCPTDNTLHALSVRFQRWCWELILISDQGYKPQATHHSLWQSPTLPIDTLFPEREHPAVPVWTMGSVCGSRRYQFLMFDCRTTPYEFKLSMGLFKIMLMMFDKSRMNITITHTEVYVWNIGVLSWRVCAPDINYSSNHLSCILFYQA